MTQEQRAERNKELKRGTNIIGLRKVSVEDLRTLNEDDDLELYIKVFDESSECRSDKDVRDVMIECNLVGTVLPVRPLPTITRTVKEVTAFE